MVIQHFRSFKSFFKHLDPDPKHCMLRSSWCTFWKLKTKVRDNRLTKKLAIDKIELFKLFKISPCRVWEPGESVSQFADFCKYTYSTVSPGLHFPGSQSLWGGNPGKSDSPGRQQTLCAHHYGEINRAQSPPDDVIGKGRHALCGESQGRAAPTDDVAMHCGESQGRAAPTDDVEMHCGESQGRAAPPDDVEMHCVERAKGEQPHLMM